MLFDEVMTLLNLLRLYHTYPIINHVFLVFLREIIFIDDLCCGTVLVRKTFQLVQTVSKPHFQRQTCLERLQIKYLMPGFQRLRGCLVLFLLKQMQKKILDRIPTSILQNSPVQKNLTLSRARTILRILEIMRLPQRSSESKTAKIILAVSPSSFIETLLFRKTSN